MHWYCDRQKTPHTFFWVVEGCASVIVVGCSTWSHGARDESCEVEAVFFPLQMMVVWLLSTVTNDRSAAGGTGPEQVWVGEAVTEGLNGAEEFACLSTLMSVLDMSTFEFGLVKETVGDLECCRDGEKKQEKILNLLWFIGNVCNHCTLSMTNFVFKGQTLTLSTRVRTLPVLGVFGDFVAEEAPICVSVFLHTLSRCQTLL